MEENKKVGKGLFIVIVLLVIVALSTYAWFSYRTDDTALVLTVGDSNSVQVTLSPYQISGTLMPRLTYTGGDYTEVTASNNLDTPKEIVLYYKINNIDTSLMSSDFKYTIERSTDGTNYTYYTEGDFSDLGNSDELAVFSETVTSTTTLHYRVYLWIDGTDNGQNYIDGKVFDGELRANIDDTYGEYVYTVNLYEDFASNHNCVLLGQPIPNGITTYTTTTAAISALEAAFSYNNGGSSDSFPFFLRHRINNGTLWCATNSSDNSESYCVYGSSSECNAVLLSQYGSGYVCEENNFTDSVSESYVGFVVTPEMAAEDLGMVVGTYYLRGGDNGKSFLTNAKTIYDAFGGLGCYGDSNLPATYDITYNPNPSDFFICEGHSLRVDVDNRGNVYVSFNGTYSDYEILGSTVCYAYQDGTSCCGTPVYGLDY